MHETCDRCGGEIHVGDFPFCKGNPQDHVIQTHHRLTPVEVDLGVLGKHTVNNFADFARLEKMHRDQTGQEIGFRAFNNEPSNQDSNSMGPGPQVPKFQTRNRRGQPFVVQRKGDYRG